MRSIVLSFILLSAWSAQMFCAEPPGIVTNKQGEWSVPLTYWAHSTPFEDAGGFMFLAEVTSLGKTPVQREGNPLVFRGGKLKVKELLWPKKGGPAGLEKVKILSVEGTEGLHVGDRIIVLVAGDVYEGDYVMRYHEGGCILGIRLPPEDDLDFGRNEQKALLDLIRAGKWDLSKLEPDEIRIWAIVDPVGVARLLIREIEMERLQWRKKI